METRVMLSFAIEPLKYHPEALSLTPVLNGALLSELALSFEREHGFEPAGGYGGLVPGWFSYGPLERYFLGESEDEYFANGCYLLGCGDCGEVGCWPLRGRIRNKGNIVIWDSFSQPHRPLRDYSDFGPFLFEVEPYRTTVLDAAAHFRSR
jgi:hypothetical protein